MEQILGKEWKITPAGGTTGEAYFAQREGKRLFLKRNSSPFLAVLSAEGIVPKLVWTKRMENGDVITAQKWLEGRELTPDEMKHDRVALLLSKIHHSTELLDLLMRLGKQPLEPEDILADLKPMASGNGFYVHKALNFLEEMLHDVRDQAKVVCHCDVNHNNWLLANNGQLYLIDWDHAVVADPAIDLGMLLHWYIPEQEWGSWLQRYGIELTDSLMKRIHWYVIAQSLSFIKWHTERGDIQESDRWQSFLESLFDQIASVNNH